MSDVVASLNAVKAAIATAEKEARRAVGSVTLVAVSKTFDADAIRPALDAGQRVFGENRVQEASGNGRACARTTPALNCTSSARCNPTRRWRPWRCST